MAGDQSSPQPGDQGDRPLRSDQGWVALSYLISGMVVWGFIGWLIDRWIGLNGVAMGIGAVLGAAGGIYLLVRRLNP
jgi:F0F1-type ATP synthase assembly protein I